MNRAAPVMEVWPSGFAVQAGAQTTADCAGQEPGW